MVVRTQTDEVRRLRRTNLELIFSDHNAYCLPPCQNKCPSHIDIPGFLKANAEGKFRESARIFKRTIPFPSILGRVCPAPCEEHCRRDEVDEAIAIRDSHRYAGDIVLAAQKDGIEAAAAVRDAAQDRQARGHRRVRAGRNVRGLLPAALRPRHHRLRAQRRPGRDAALRHPGVPAAQGRCPRSRVRGRLAARRQDRVQPGPRRDFTLDDLRERGFDATIVATGCYDTNKLGVPNENAVGVIDGLEYLKIATLGLPYPGHAGSRVVVVGGGFTAMDCTRTSVRQGAKEITLVYRRDMKDMPAASEAHEAIEEGAKMIFQAGPTRVITDAKNRVTGVEFIRMQPGAPDASGRRRPEPAPGTEFVIKCDRVLLAIGQGPDLSWVGPGSDGIESNRNRLKADAVTFETGRTGVFGSGDVRIGAATVVQAIAEGRRCAYAVDAFLRGTDLSELRSPRAAGRGSSSSSRSRPTRTRSRSPATASRRCRRRSAPRTTIEYEIPYTQSEVMAESSRCLQCTCEAIGYCDLRNLGLEYGTTLDTLEPAHNGAPASAASPRTASPAPTTTTSATTATPSSCASRRAASTAAAAPPSAPTSSAPPATTSCASASTRS
jgi:NADPH-dependent glutamate synthase beta subunit-like oxidoreductase